jgi:hypothetical protein
MTRRWWLSLAMTRRCWLSLALPERSGGAAQRRWAALALLGGCALALASPAATAAALPSLAATAAAQATPGQVVSGPDGTLYLVTDAGRYTLVPGEISDADLAALPDLGTVTGELPPPGAAAPAPAEAAPPEAAPPEAGPEPAAGPEAEAPPAAAPAPAAEAPITIEGQGSMVSRPFGLRGGEYAVTWSAQTSNPECSHNATLHDSATARVVGPLGGGQVFGGRGSGQASLHDLPGGSYYIDAVSTCRWSITITPLS